MSEGARYEGRLVVITGGGRGIGAAIACSFGREGARVVIAEVVAELREDSVSAARRRIEHIGYSRGRRRSGLCWGSWRSAC